MRNTVCIPIDDNAVNRNINKGIYMFLGDMDCQSVHSILNSVMFSQYLLGIIVMRQRGLYLPSIPIVS